MAFNATKFNRHKVAGLLRNGEFVLDYGFDRSRLSLPHLVHNVKKFRTRTKLLPDAVLAEQPDKFVDIYRF